MARPTGRDIRGEVIEAATRAVQAHGVGGFSYATLATDLAIKPPSIHHHFPRKADLLTAVVTQYRRSFRAEVETLDVESAFGRLEAYSLLFSRPAQHNLMCLCGAAAADWDGFDEAGRAEVATFFEHEIAWVAEQALQAIESGEFRSDVNPDAFARAFVAALEGSLLLARAAADPGVVSGNESTLLHLAANHR
jgi:TetR/AcrR family transcriptional regulator, transcriptional repressor for nem operon